MAILKSEVKRISISMPKSFLKNLDDHLANFALTDRSRWLIEAAREKMAKEKVSLSEMEEEEDEELEIK
jgi:metal-responsive CopG/Arc/MetJ family transcriptional regulator